MHDLVKQLDHSDFSSEILLIHFSQLPSQPRETRVGAAVAVVLSEMDDIFLFIEGKI